MLTEKQKEVWECFKNESPRILICHGAKRSGKTFVLTLAFLAHIAKFNGKGLSFIIAGATISSVRRNVLSEMERLVGKSLPFDKHNAVSLFGNKIYCFGGENSDSWKSVRGFTAAGAYINEATAVNDYFLREVISRCSHEGARIFIDTNPENPRSNVKINFIDKAGVMLSNQHVNIAAFQFSIFDNTALDAEYVESIVAATPSGMYYDRDILGLWTGAEGRIYPMFGENCIAAAGEQFAVVCIGVDIGGNMSATSFTLVGITKQREVYVVDEFFDEKNQDAESLIRNFCDISRKWKKAYPRLSDCRVDSAEQLFVKSFRAAASGFNVLNAKKTSINGRIYVINRLITQGRFFVDRRCKHLIEAMETSVWDSGEKGRDARLDNGKLNVDSLDSMEYALEPYFDELLAAVPPELAAAERGFR
ncbi:MAG: PBSX family phage terminase large subunit [Clostridiales bacterium]|jgi:PBSX family phage terminase large subunit|nr:PBSX family phage terminase large subunit [Clostridiales bacterium]